MIKPVQTNGTQSAGGSPPALPEAEMLAAAKAEWRPTAHPLLPWFTDAELLAVLRTPDGPETVEKLYAEREERIALAQDDGEPLRYGFELPNWRDADAMAAQFKFLYVAGGKRASKSERAAKRLVQAALKYPRGILWAFQGNAKTSIATQQALVWKFFPPALKALNGKQDRRKVFSVNFSEKNGFADGVVVLPNKTKIHFLTYEMDVKQYQGWSIGSPWRPGQPMTETEQRMAALADGGAGGSCIENLGFWADEDMPFPWLETCELRASTYNAKGLWTFSTTDGITPAIKQVLGTAVTLETRPAELLANRVNVPNIARGEMPYRQKAERNDWGAIFFFSEFNPFGDNYANVRKFCEGKTSDVIMENAYGYARDTRHKAFPLFGEWNIVPRAKLPHRMTRYMLTDPGGASRNWATIWVGAAENGCFYIYRDWPDCQTYGEWAVPSDDPRQPDGQRGPAQRSLGFGYSQLAEMWRRLEQMGFQPQMDTDETQMKKPPRHDGKVRMTPLKAVAAEPLNREAGRREEIFDRYIDPRAAKNPHLDQEGGTDAYQEFAALPDPMIFQGFSGQRMATGYDAINELLYWNRDEPLNWPMNAPKLYVCEDAQQVIWMFTNFTGMGGDKAGGKDFADLVRGMALADLQYYESNEFKSSGPGKGY